MRRGFTECHTLPCDMVSGETLELHCSFRLDTVARYGVTRNLDQNVLGPWGTIGELVLARNVLSCQTESSKSLNIFIPAGMHPTS